MCCTVEVINDKSDECEEMMSEVGTLEAIGVADALAQVLVGGVVCEPTELVLDGL